MIFERLASFRCRLAQSYDNKIWVFDEQESKIRKLDEEGKIIFSTADLRLVFSTPFSLTVMFDMGGIFIYMIPSRACLSLIIMGH